MSGHEKFYIPHDDLLALKTAMETLDATMTVFNTNIVTLSKCFLRPDTELVVTDTGTLEAGYETQGIISGAFSATVDVYLTRMRVVLIGTEDIFKLYDTDIGVSVSAAGTAVITEWFCNGIHPMVPSNAAKTLWSGQRMFDLGEARVPAGGNVALSMGGAGTPSDVPVAAWIWYRKEVVL